MSCLQTTDYNKTMVMHSLPKKKSNCGDGVDEDSGERGGGLGVLAWRSRRGLHVESIRVNAVVPAAATSGDESLDLATIVLQLERITKTDWIASEQRGLDGLVGEFGADGELCAISIACHVFVS